jgi:hypothetical protein
MGYLDQWVDPTQKVTETIDEEAFVAKQSTRLLELYIILQYAKDIPRRLGGLASAEELGQDKKFCKTMRGRVVMYFGLWSDQDISIDEAIMNYPGETRELKERAGTIRWDEWFQEYGEYIRKELTTIANFYAKKSKKDRKIGNSLANLLENEAVQFELVYKTIYG